MTCKCNALTSPTKHDCPTMCFATPPGFLGYFKECISIHVKSSVFVPMLRLFQCYPLKKQFGLQLMFPSSFVSALLWPTVLKQSVSILDTVLFGCLVLSTKCDGKVTPGKGVCLTPVYVGMGKSKGLKFTRSFNPLLQLQFCSSFRALHQHC